MEDTSNMTLDEFSSSNHPIERTYNPLASGAIPHGPDSQLYVYFEERAIEYPQATERARLEASKKGLPDPGPQVKKHVFVHIASPGDRLEAIERVATDKDKRRFPAQWQSFLSGKGREVQGTPLTALKSMDLEKTEVLRSLKIFTVEQLSECSDTTIQQMGPGAREWVKEAAAFMDNKQNYSKNVELQNEIDELKSQVKELLNVKGNKGNNVSKTTTKKVKSKSEDIFEI